MCGRDDDTVQLSSAEQPRYNAGTRRVVLRAVYDVAKLAQRPVRMTYAFQIGNNAEQQNDEPKQRIQAVLGW